MHNGNHLVNCSHGWGRYRNWSRVVGDAPMVANSSEAGGRAPVTGASFDAQFRSARDLAAKGEAFVWNLPSNVRDQKRPVRKSEFYGAFVLNRRAVLHAIDATPARWRGDAGLHPTHWLISTQDRARH